MSSPPLDTPATGPIDSLRAALADRYLVEKLVGEGGMATVYRAQDVRHERTVAIKVLRPELGASIGGDRFLREIRVAAKLQHPNVLPLYDSGETPNGTLYYVMPFVEGESLRGRLEREQQLSLEEAIAITCEVADALHYAHGQGIVHRDIKPENILLQDGRAVVADFGIARAVSQAKGEKLTETGMSVGTPLYMSPEQALGLEHVDGRSDLYSLGCVLYEMLIGQPPFTGPNAMAILARHSMEAVPSLQVVRQSIPDEVEDAIMRALEKTPADRFPTMRDFADALVAADLGPAARRSSARITARRSARVARPSAAGRAPTVETVAVRRQSKASRLPRLWIAGPAALAVVALAAGWFVWHRRAASAPSGPDPRHLAVLYFDARGGGDSLGSVADGLTEALIHELSAVKPLQVISANGVRPYRRKDVTPDSLSRALKVGTLVQGTLSGSADSLRLSVSLIAAESGTEIGSRTLSRPRAELFALQDDLAKEVAIFLRKQLGQEVRLDESRAETRSVAAWQALQDAYARVRDIEPILQTGDTATIGRELTRADSGFSRASALDPDWATPITQRGWLAYRRTRLAGSFDKTYYAEWIDKGMAQAERALALKPNDADALELRGTLRYWRLLLNLAPDPAGSARLLADAEADLRASVAANPIQASAWTTLSHLLLRKGETAEGKLAALRAYEADPYLTNANLTLWRLAASSVDLDDATEANKWCAEGRRRFPADPRFAECQIYVMSLKGQKPDVPKAWSLLDEYVRLSPPNMREFRQHEGEMLVAIAIARAGLADSARKVAEHARADASVDPTRDLAQWEAYLRAILGDKDEAFRQLSIYLAANPQERVNLAKEDTWWLRDLRSDPRWKSLVAGG
jgi:serine/threonine-protein kinase